MGKALKSKGACGGKGQGIQGQKGLGQRWSSGKVEHGWGEGAAQLF